jgi:methylthioribose-1-phosphate isomerase
MARTALEENQANGISTVFNGAARIFGAGNTANFNAGTHRQAIAAFRQACRQSGCKRNRIPAIA